jgi:Tol biopolymer transport system component
MSVRHISRHARRSLLASVASVTLAACASSAAPVSSTTTAHQRATKAPPAPDRAVAESTGETPVPRADDAHERIAFLRGGSVYLLDPRGGAEPVKVAQRGAQPDTSPAFSPHGDSIAWATGGKLFVSALDGSGARAVTDGKDGGDSEPAWSPDGRRLVFVRGRVGERRDLYLLDFDAGSVAKPLLEGKDAAPAHVGSPAWSPDGAWIVFSADRSEGEGTGLWKIAPDGTGLLRLTRPGRSAAWVRDERAAFAPDGKTVAFASNRDARSEDDAADLDLYALDVASGKVTRLTRDPGVADDPSYSPDGKRLYFTSTRDSKKEYEVELYAMPAAGGEQLRLTRDASPQNAAPSAGRVP